MKGLSHLDARGRARMVDVGGKPETRRTAIAAGEIRMKPETIRLLSSGGLPKGDALAAARIAGILAAKRVDEIIPLCHSLNLDAVELDFEVQQDRVRVNARVAVTGRTGAEMEALTAAAAACLTLYDMAKAVDRDMEIGAICLLEKTGGRSGHYLRARHG